MQWWNTQRLKSKSPQTRLAAITKLAETRSAESVHLLMAALEDEDISVRKAAIATLGKWHVRQAARSLLQSLQDTSPEIREEAIVALREIGATEFTDHIVGLLDDKHAGVRSQAAKTLDRFRWKPSNDQERILFDAAMGRFVSASDMGPSALNIVTKTLTGGNATDKLGAVDALGRIGGEEVIPSLLAALRDTERSVQVAALEALKDIKDSRAMQPVIACLRHQEATVRAAAVQALIPYAEQAFSALQRCLGDRHWSVRKAAVEAFGRAKDPSQVEFILPLLHDPDHDVREATCEALGRIKHRSAVTGLVLALTDSQTSVRQYASAALREIEFNWETFPEARTALPQLKESLKDREYWVRQSAREAIKRIESAETCDLEVAVANEKQVAALNVIASLLKSQRPEFRLAAAEALGRFENPEMAGFLSAALPDGEEFVTKALVESLRKCGVTTPTPTDSAIRPSAAVELPRDE